MRKPKFPGPCSACGKEQEYYKKELCDNCYRKMRRRKRGLRPSAVRKQLGPCDACGSSTSSNGRFTRGLCVACYKRIILRGGNVKPRSRYSGPCVRCGVSDSSAKFVKMRCPKCESWYRNNIKLSNTNHRARKSGTVVDLTEEQWLRVLQHFEYRCAYCDKDIHDKFTIDHVVPLSKGGTHTIDNVVCSCISCNSAKKDGLPPRPVVTLRE